MCGKLATTLARCPVPGTSQCDTFFSSDKGRLKLRVVNADAQLIYYSRSDQAGPKTSEFIVAPVVEVATMKAALSAALTVRGEVEKERYLFMAGRTRIHCDRVKVIYILI